MPNSLHWTPRNRAWCARVLLPLQLQLSDRVFVLSMCCAVLPQISLLQWAHVMSDVLELPGMPWCSVARTVADLDASGRIQFSKFLDRCATCVHVCHHLLPCANECLCG